MCENNFKHVSHIVSMLPPVIGYELLTNLTGIHKADELTNEHNFQSKIFVFESTEERFNN